MPSQPPSAYLARFWFDTILHSPEALAYLRDLVGSERLLLGTDYPFPVDDPAPLQSLADAGCSQVEIDQISGGNASALFKL